MSAIPTSVVVTKRGRIKTINVLMPDERFCSFVDSYATLVCERVTIDLTIAFLVVRIGLEGRGVTKRSKVLCQVKLGVDSVVLERPDLSHVMPELVSGLGSERDQNDRRIGDPGDLLVLTIT